MALTKKQAAFVQEYLIDLNATQAAIRAGYSERTAAVIGHENLKKPKIQKVIQAKMEAREEKALITAEEVINGIREIAFPEKGQEVRDNDRLKALELLGKHLALFTDKVEHGGNMGVQIIDNIPSDADEED